MKWLRTLTSKPDERPAPGAGSSRTPVKGGPRPPAPDIEGLRQALRAAATEEERAKAALELGHGLAAARRAPVEDDPPAAWIEAVCQVSDKALAGEWAGRLGDDESLAQIARRGRYAEVRLAAARRLTDSAVIESVAEASRDKDRGVYRHCMDVLKERKRAENLAQRSADLAQALREAMGVTPLPASRLAELEKEFQGLGQDPDALAECAASLEQVRTRVREEAHALRELQGWAKEAAGLRAELKKDIWPLGEILDDGRGRCETLRAAHANLPEWLAKHASARELERCLQEADARLALLFQDAERALACERFLESIPSDAPLLEDTRSAWEALEKPASAAARSTLDHRWKALMARGAPPPEPVAAEPAAKVPPKAKFDSEAARGLLEELEKQLEDGQLHDAEATDRKLEAALHGAPVHGSLERRLRRVKGQLSRLRGWARWGTHEAREHLIEAAEELLRNETDVDERAHAVPALREEWKRADAHGPASKSQWERFDSTLEKAYAPVLERRAEEAARHDAARAAKNALLEEWEAWLGGISWENADLRVVEAERRAMLGKWRAAARAGFKNERQLNKRLDALLGAINSRLTEARSAEVARREQLIAAAETLKDEPDIGKSVNEAKALQAKWKEESEALRLNRGQEQKLWKRFRAACDVIFGRRDAERAGRDAERQQQREARKAQLDEFEGTLQGNDAGEIARALAQFRNTLRATERVPRQRQDALEERARNLARRAEDRIDALRRDKHQARFTVMAQKASLAEKVEAAAIAGEPTEAVVAEARQCWEALPHLPGKVERPLAERLANAPTATRDRLQQGEEARDALLLDMEIALGIPSPEELSEARRARQLERLQQHFGAGSDAENDPESMLARWYSIPAVPDPAQEPRIQAVVAKVATAGTGRGG